MKTTKNNAQTTANTLETKTSFLNAELQKQLTELNFNSLIKESSSKKDLYKYPESLLNMKSNEQEKKSFRRKLRTQSTNKVLILANKLKENICTIEDIKEFNLFYISNFNCNDYTLQSFTQQSEKNAENHLFLNSLKIVLEVCKANQ